MAAAHYNESSTPASTMKATDQTTLSLANGNGQATKEVNQKTDASRVSPLASNANAMESGSVADSMPGLPDAEQIARPSSPPQKTDLEKSKAKTALLVFALCMCVFLAALDTTIITTALPTISEYFNSSSGYTWIGSAYLLGSAASVPLWAKWSDIFGRKPVLLMANVVFFIGSLVAALSTSIGMLIVARAIQGIGGGGLLTLVSVCIGDLFSMRQRGMYYGIIGFVWAVASAIGPLLGGVFTQKVTWRWCFYINLPFQGIAFMIVIFFLNIHTPKTSVRRGLAAIDWLGALLIVGGIVMFLLGLEYGGVSHPWSSAIVLCLIIFGIFTIFLFVLNEWRFAKYPIIPLHIFHNVSNVAVLTVNFMHGYVFIGGTFYLPLYFQAVLGYSPIMSGVLLLAMVLPLSFASMLSGITIRKTGNYQYPIWIGIFFQTLGFGLFINLDANPGLAKIIIYQMIAGIGTGPNFQAPLIALQTQTPPQDIAAAVALFQLVRNCATAISVVIGGVVFQNAIQSQFGILQAALGDELAGRLSGFNAAASAGVISSLPEAQKAVTRAVFASALQKMWIMYVCFPAFGLAVAFLIKKKTLTTEHQVTKTGLEAEEEKRADRADARQARKESKAARKSVSGQTPLSSPRSPKVFENERNSDSFGKEEV